MSEIATGLTAEMYRAVVTVVDDRIGDMRVSHQGCRGLKRNVRGLAHAQARTE